MGKKNAANVEQGAAAETLAAENANDSVPVKTSKQRRQEEFDRLAAEVRKAKGYDEGHGHSHGGDHKKKKKGKKKAEPYNWSAIVIMALMIIPAVITLALNVYDSYFPEQARQRQIANALRACYEVVDPSKLNNIPSIVEKYAGRERRLFMKLMDKYPDDPECHIRASVPED